MNVFITGANGFVASYAAAAFTARGWDVGGSTSRAGAVRPGVIYHRNGESFPHYVLQSVNLVVHCAHDFTPGNGALNVSGISALASAAASDGVARQVFVSSLSARSDATSEYGRTKYAIERAICGIPGMTIVRPGTVIGNGGVFGRLVAAIRRLPIIPLIDGGRRQMQLIGAADLADGLVIAGTENVSGRDLNLYYCEQPTLRELVTAIENILRLRRAHVAIPAQPLLWLLRGVQRLGLRPPIDADNVRGFIVGSHSVPASSSDLIGRIQRMPLDSTLRNLVT